MPNFLYTIILLASLLWYGLFKYMDSVAPQTLTSKVVFTLIFFFAVNLSLSVINYVYHFKKAPKLTSLKKIYRSALRQSTKTSLVISVFLFLKLLEVLSVVSLTIATIAFLIYQRYKLKRSRFKP